VVELDKNMFESLLQSSTATQKRTSSKCAWDEVMDALQKDGRVLSTRQLFEEFVEKREDAVKLYRTKEWLHKQFEEEKTCLRVYKDGRYWWTFNPTMVKAFFSRKG